MHGCYYSSFQTNHETGLEDVVKDVANFKYVIIKHFFSTCTFRPFSLVFTVDLTIWIWRFFTYRSKLQ